ncbi:MAG TPA: thiamine pyrophosphate-binding protein, partial [Armatimonadota bacterium]|nr:thiamine pyrophosphate-binding protein [Armatimonadota bacterium]
MTGGEIVLRFLIRQGVRVGFGIPGALNAHLYDALPRLEREFRHVLVRHELGGAWMADGFARARNDVGVAFTVPGPGATHAASAVAGAYTDCSRLLLLSSQSESSLRGEFRRDLFHGLDQQRLFAPITKWSAAVQRAEEIPEVLEEAFRRLRTGRPGPVQVEIPADVLGSDAGEPPLADTIPFRDRAPDPALLNTAVAALRSARRPLILAGDGVLHADAGEALGQVASLLRAPVITTVMGKGSLPEDHPWSLGDSNSAAGSAAYAEHDLLLAVGERFTQVDTRWPWFFPPRRLVHLESDAREVGRVFVPEVGLVGDPAAGLRALADGLRADPGERDGWDALLPPLKARSDAREAHPVLSALRAALPREALVSFDVCVPGFRSRMDWHAYEPHGYFYPGVYVGMGFGLPAGIGAKLARPDRPVCVVAGDGGFQMTMAELGTAVQHDVPLVVVVVNDAGLTLIRRVQDRDFAGRRCEVDLVNPDFVALAAAYGIPA